MLNESTLLDCTDLIGDHDRLLDHGLQNGYLFFPELLPPDPVLDLRRQVLCVADQHDLLEPVLIPTPAYAEKVFSSVNRMDLRPTDASTPTSRKSDPFTNFPIMNISRVFWKHYLANLFVSTLVIFATSSSRENTSIPLLPIRTSIRFAVRRTRGLCGHRWETVTLS